VAAHKHTASLHDSVHAPIFCRHLFELGMWNAHVFEDYVNHILLARHPALSLPELMLMSFLHFRKPHRHHNMVACFPSAPPSVSNTRPSKHRVC
jgi:hypothetical protein